MPNISIGWAFADIFNRDSLNPTGAYELYTGTAPVGTGTNFLTAYQYVRINASNAINDNYDLYVSGFVPYVADLLLAINGFTVDIIFRAAVTYTDKKAFTGVIEASGAMTAIPTTESHAGVYADSSVDDNLYLSIGNGTTQQTSDTGVAMDSTFRGLRIVWNGVDDVTVKLYDYTFTTLIDSLQRTDMDLDYGVIHAYVEALAATNTSWDIWGWRISAN